MNEGTIPLKPKQWLKYLDARKNKIKWKKERKKNDYYLYRRPPGSGLASHFWSLSPPDPAGAGGAKEDGQASGNRGPAGSLPLRLRSQPANPGGPNYSKPMPGAPNTWGPPGLQELLTVPAPCVLRVGLPPPTDILRVAPPRSGSILSTAVAAVGLCLPGWRGRAERSGDTSSWALGWHTALELQPTNRPFTKALVAWASQGGLATCCRLVDTFRNCNLGPRADGRDSFTTRF